MILVAGGTGRLGSLVVDSLRERSDGVRILTRDPTRVGRAIGEVDVAVGDVRDRRSLKAALDGVDVVVSAVHGFTGRRDNSPASVDRAGNANLTDAALAAGAELVLVSIVGACADSPIELFRMKYAAEQYAITSGVPTTIVRSTAFADLWIELIRETARNSGRPLVFGRGNNPINFVAVSDVAALVRYAIVDASTRGATFEIGGPENLSFTELAAMVQTADGRPDKTPRHIPPIALRIMSATVGRVKPELGRQARAALVMDRDDFSFDAAAIHRAMPDLPSTPVSTILHRHE
ncbi:MAG: SDR family oxidoreductase [Acidimicrobiales bacterium]